MAAKKFLSGVDLQNQKAINLADGSAATDAVTLQQLQSYVRGLSWKASARAASTANITLTAPGATVDGVTLSNGDRLLLKNQTTASQNGLYQFNGSASTLTRTSDATNAAGAPDGVQTLTEGLAVYVAEGTVNADTAYVLTTDNPITVDTTSLTFSQFGGGSAPYTAGNGIAINSNAISVTAAANGAITVAAGGVSVQLVTNGGLSSGASGLQVVAGTGITVGAGGVSIDTTKVAQKFSASVGDGSSTAIVVTHNLGTRDVHVALYDSSSFAEVETDIGHTSTTTITLTFAVAPASNAYRCVVIG